MYYAFTPNSVFKLVPPFGLRIYLINQYVILRYYSSNLCKWHYLYGDLPFFMTERLHFHFSLSGIGEGNGNPLQCSCLENPRDRGAWQAIVFGVARAGHDWSDLAAVAATHLIREIKGKWSRSVMSNSLRPPWTVTYQAPLMGFSRQ